MPARRPVIELFNKDWTSEAWERSQFPISALQWRKRLHWRLRCQLLTSQTKTPPTRKSVFIILLWWIFLRRLERTIWMIKKNVSQHSKIVAKVSTCGKTKRRKVFHQMLINLWGVHPWLGPPSTVHLIIIKSSHSIAAWQSKLRIPKFFEELFHFLSPPPPARFLTCTRKRQGRHRQPRSSWRC